MNDWVYLILIAAILGVAGILLYARFRSQSSGRKLVHHSLGSGGSGIAPVPSEERGAGEELLSEPPGAAKEGATPDACEDTTSNEARQSNSSLEAGSLRARFREEQEQAVKEKDAYLDELQDAAAGLAMLMRSSPVQDRVSPVVFEPEAEPAETGAEEKPRLRVPEPSETEEESVPQEEAVLAEEAAPVTAETAESEEELPGSGAPRSEVVETIPIDESIRRLLGDEVAERFEHIDEGLDALQSLVERVESQLEGIDAGGEPARSSAESAGEADDRSVEEAA